jgi:hypothetical protein
MPISLTTLRFQIRATTSEDNEKKATTSNAMPALGVVNNSRIKNGRYISQSCALVPKFGVDLSTHSKNISERNPEET